MVYFAAHESSSSVTEKGYKEVKFQTTIHPSSLTCKQHLSLQDSSKYSAKFYEQRWLQERTWKDQLQRKNVSYRISFSKFIPSEFNWQFLGQLRDDKRV